MLNKDNDLQILIERVTKLTGNFHPFKGSIYHFVKEFRDLIELVLEHNDSKSSCKDTRYLICTALIVYNYVKENPYYELDTCNDRVVYEDVGIDTVIITLLHAFCYNGDIDYTIDKIKELIVPKYKDKLYTNVFTGIRMLELTDSNYGSEELEYSMAIIKQAISIYPVVYCNTKTIQDSRNEKTPDMKLLKFITTNMVNLRALKVSELKDDFFKYIFDITIENAIYIHKTMYRYISTFGIEDLEKKKL